MGLRSVFLVYSPSLCTKPLYLQAMPVTRYAVLCPFVSLKQSYMGYIYTYTNNILPHCLWLICVLSRYNARLVSPTSTSTSTSTSTPLPLSLSFATPSPCLSSHCPYYHINIHYLLSHLTRALHQHTCNRRIGRMYLLQYPFSTSNNYAA